MFTRIMLVIASLTLGSAWMLRDADAKPGGSGLLVVANQKEHTVLVVDPDERRELAKIVVGVNGHEVMASKDGRVAYVPIYGNSGVGRPGTHGSTIDVVDLQERKLTATIDLGKPLRPHRAEWGPDSLLYVTAELANAVDVVDPETRKVVAEIPTGQKESHMLVYRSIFPIIKKNQVETDIYLEVVTQYEEGEEPQGLYLSAETVQLLSEMGGALDNDVMVTPTRKPRL